MKILTLNASPVKESSTEILLGKIVEGIENSGPTSMENRIIRLNDFVITPCQACGINPEPDWCIYHDDIYAVYDLLVNSDIVLFGSPIYFDTVSAQAKLFIDRCNCLRPVDFETLQFRHRIMRKRWGAIVLVGGERQKFECARTVIAGFFKWVNIENVGCIAHAGHSFSPGSAKDSSQAQYEALSLGSKLYQASRGK